MKKILSIIAIAMAMVGCAQNKGKETLVIYYSQTGATETVAQEVAGLLGADIVKIDVTNPYNGTYAETIARSQEETAANILPELIELDVDLSKYETIFLGYPIWFGTYAPPVAALVKDFDFAGKKIVPFCTFGSGGLGASMADLKKALPESEILQGYGVRNARIAKAAAEVKRFLIENGHIEGAIEALADYSEPQAVTAEEVAIFDAACGDYQYPIGTPVTAGKRATSTGVDYVYAVKSPGSEEVSATVYVTVENTPDAKPEFTEVVR